MPYIATAGQKEVCSDDCREGKGEEERVVIGD